jgi:transcriptional regulator with XRE-family HTH domain
MDRMEENNKEVFQKMIGDALRQLRQAAGLSQRDLAEQLDLSPQQIQQFERGDNALPLERVQAFAEALGVTPTQLAFPNGHGDKVSPGAIQSPDRSESLRLCDSIADKKSRQELAGSATDVGRVGEETAPLSSRPAAEDVRN